MRHPIKSDTKLIAARLKCTPSEQAASTEEWNLWQRHSYSLIFLDQEILVKADIVAGYCMA